MHLKFYSFFQFLCNDVAHVAEMGRFGGLENMLRLISEMIDLLCKGDDQCLAR